MVLPNLLPISWICGPTKPVTYLLVLWSYQTYCYLSVLWSYQTCYLSLLWSYQTYCYLSVLWSYHTCYLSVLWSYQTYCYLSVLWSYQTCHLSVLWSYQTCHLSLGTVVLPNLLSPISTVVLPNPSPISSVVLPNLLSPISTVVLPNLLSPISTVVLPNLLSPISTVVLPNLLSPISTVVLPNLLSPISTVVLPNLLVTYQYCGPTKPTDKLQSYLTPAASMASLSISRAPEAGWNCALPMLGFPKLGHTSDSKLGTLVAALPDTWRYRVSARTGRPRVSILCLDGTASLIFSFYLSVAARLIV